VIDQVQVAVAVYENVHDDVHLNVKVDVDGSAAL